MASMAARAQRNNRARVELERLLERVARRLNVEVPPEARTMKDPELRPIVEVERFVAMMTSIDEALDELSIEGATPEGIEAFSMKMLREYAKERDIKVPGNVRKREDVAAYIKDVEERLKADDAESQEVDADAGEGDAPLPPLSEVVHPTELGTVTVDEDGVQHEATPPTFERVEPPANADDLDDDVKP